MPLALLPLTMASPAGFPWWLAVPALLVYALVCLVHPVVTCPDCRGKRTVRRGDARRGRPVPCPTCKSRGKIVLPGAKYVHRFRQMARRDRDRKLPELPKED